MALRFLSPVHKAGRQIARYLEHECSDLDLSATEIHMLSYLSGYSPAPVGELHRVLGVKRSTLTSLLDRLEARAWVERRPSPRDRRSVMVGLTSAGHTAADAVQAVIEALEAAIADRARPADIAGFNAVLSAISTATEI